jgi:glycosyltransferase involved in cell wall biosynthesis
LTPTRIAVYKGLDFLVDFIFDNKLFLENNNILFLISIPDYPFSDQEKELFDNIKVKIEKSEISNLVKFIFLKYEDMKKAYSVADIFFLPSEKEQLPMSILEAMACEIPVIATKVGGVPELLEHGKEAYIVDFGDKMAVKQSIEKYLIIENHTENRKNAYKKVVEKYSIEKISSTYRELYKRCKKQC